MRERERRRGGKERGEVGVGRKGGEEEKLKDENL